MNINTSEGIVSLDYDPLIYWEIRAGQWASATHSDPLWEKELIKHLNPDWKVLELGCGDGRWSEFFPHYVGADISPTLLGYASTRHPGKDFAHHDMRNNVKKANFDLIFTFTAWEHISPSDIKKVKLPKCNLLFVEPHRKSTSEHCWRHDYCKLFACERVKRIGELTLYKKTI